MTVSADATSLAVAEEPRDGAAPQRKRSLLPLIIAALVVTLLGGGASAWFFFFRGQPKTVEKKETAKPPEHIFKAGTLVVNIAGTEGRRYLRTTLEVGVGAKDGKHVNELKPVLLDGAHAVLGTKPLPELLQPDGRQALKDELREHLNQAIGKTVITHVFLTEFVVQ
jgi:flagellar FliL protein